MASRNVKIASGTAKQRAVANRRVEVPDPSQCSAAHEIMSSRWSAIDTLLAGTEAMRSAGDIYLPRHDSENDIRYAQRLNGNFLHNGTAQALKDMVSGPFSEPVVLSEDMPDDIRQLMADVDLQGNNIDVFARQWFEKAAAKAFCHVLVDFPRVVPPVEGEVRTRAEDLKSRARPYMTIIAPENLIFAYAEDEGGKQVLKQIRVLEEITRLDGFKEVCVKQIRVITPGMVELYHEFEVGKDRKEWRVVESYPYELDEIPLVTCYADKEMFMVGKPPLTDIADMNIRHWQSNSDQIIALTASRFPMLAFIGLGEDATSETVIGPYQAFKMSDAGGRIEYVEHGGASIAAGQAELQSLEDRMKEYSSKLLQKPSATATSHILSSQSANSPVQDMVIRFEDAFNSALVIMGKWLKKSATDKVGSINVNRSFGVDQTDKADLPTLDKARERKEISRKAYLSELMRRGVLDEKYDIDKDEAVLAEEAMNIPDPIAITDLNPLDGVPPVKTEIPAAPKK